MYPYIKRFVDILLSLILVLLLSPLIIVISISIMINSGTPIFYLQERVGIDWKKFRIIKFRTMVTNADVIGPGISSEDDSRITKIGKILRKYKIDELPQLFNVFIGDMSLIGPRPELAKYAEYYREDYSRILKIKPGITDFASISYRDEALLLNGKKKESEIFYLKQILPQKISLYDKYLEEISPTTDAKILFSTIKALFR